MPNIYYIMRDPNHFKDPDNFKPERFIQGDGSFQPNEHVIPFGIGKRHCLGQSLAEKEYYMFFVGILQQFNIKATAGKPMPEYGPSDTSGEGMIRYPPEHTFKMCTR